jgi:hypothetical protein
MYPVVLCHLSVQGAERSDISIVHSHLHTTGSYYYPFHDSLQNYGSIHIIIWIGILEFYIHMTVRHYI